ncbi:hypothetical protein QBC43DRAFT_369820 [Cladorrhinum sp. PSN259]|nr:hypothetical protein QBC43DRAFT_369820 [Cladorrhinum sp. PSN259]
MAPKRKTSTLAEAPKRQRVSVRSTAAQRNFEADNDSDHGNDVHGSSDDKLSNGGLSDDDGLFVSEEFDDEYADNASNDGDVADNDSADHDGQKRREALDDLAPVSDVLEMFQDTVTRVEPPKVSLTYRLKVATICSGTDAPIFALNLLNEAIVTVKNEQLFTFDHLFSCEIEPFKQGFIRRNLPHSTVIFRDVVEMAAAALTLGGQVMTASGSKEMIPPDRLDILFCGCSCVDYSNMNSKKPKTRIDILDTWLKDKNTKGANGKTNPHDYPVKRDKDFRNTLLRCQEALKKPTIGESTRTFFAALTLINEKRPKIVVLENVFGAPWDMYRKQIFPLIGYYADFLRLDSKDFYLPQTRQRGYLIAVDAESLGSDTAKEIVDKWKETMELCKRSTSATVTDFLKGPDEPATVQARAEMEQSRSQSRISTKAEWNLSYLRHQTERRHHQLDMSDNPVSMKFMRCGRVVSAIFPDHSWRHWFGIQPTRIVDFLDIIVAAGNAVDIYLGYKTCVIDVSQNVDRSNPIHVRLAQGRREASLKGSLGVIGCITPSGCPFVTDLMRPITGTEVMALQGMPVDEMVISSETQAQLRDLAGNAMTVTVVGAAAYSILKSVLRVKPSLFKHVAPSDKLPTPRSTPARAVLPDMPRPHQNAPHGLGLKQEEASSVYKVVQQMARRCHCPPTSFEGFKNDFVQCEKCGSSACRSCRGNPEHDFAEAGLTDSSAISAEEGKARLKRLLPGVVRLKFDFPKGDIEYIGSELYRKVLVEVLLDADMIHYYFSEIKVTEVVTVTYKSTLSTSQLVISPPSRIAIWYIYLAPNHPSHAKLIKEEGLGFNIHQPIARGRFELFTLEMLPEWRLWAPGKIQGTVRITKRPNGVLDYSALQRKIEGEHSHCPSCGTAGNQLHVKEADEDDPRVFLFRECSRLGPWKLDAFLWAESMRRMETHEYREVLMHLDVKHKPNAMKQDCELVAAVHVTGYWADCIGLTVRYQTLSPIIPTWTAVEKLMRAECPGNAPADYDASTSRLAEVIADISEFPLSSALRYRLERSGDNNYFRVPPPQRDSFLNHISYAFVRFPGNSETVQNAVEAFDAFEAWASVARCGHCAVAPPEVSILVKNDPTKAKSTRKEAVEDPTEAARFEQQLQQLPRAVMVEALLDGNYLGIRINLAPRTLPSRAFAQLSIAHRSETRGRSDMEQNAKTGFKIELNYANPSNLLFSPLYDEIKPCGGDNTEGIIAPGSPRWLPITINFPRFGRVMTKRKLRGKLVPGQEEYHLRRDQEEAVEWMLQRELSPTSFIEAEFEEEVVRPLNMRVVGKASWETKFPYSSRGGVCAHDIGYGKTVITLALIDCQFEYDRTHSKSDREKYVDNAWRKELAQTFQSLQMKRQYPELQPGAFFHHLDATLIVVPDHICNQWMQEAQKFLGITPPKVLIIKTAPQMHEKVDLVALQQAEIIIISAKVFSSASFLQRLEQVSGRPDAAKGISGRHLDIWYRDAMRNIRLLTAYYLAGTAANVGSHELLRRIKHEMIPDMILEASQNLDALEQKIVAPSSRGLYKNGVCSANEKSKLTRTKQAGTNAKSPKECDWSPNWLHNCSFARIVWDECSYESKNVALFVENAVSNAKWLLSGTPKLFGLEEVCKTAKVFGVHVARPEPRLMPGLPAITKGPEWDIRSRSEDFYRFSSPVKTASLALNRHEQAVQFVRQFYRANHLPKCTIDYEEAVLPVPMAQLTSVRYQMICQEVEDAGGDFSALPAHARDEIKPTNTQFARDKVDPGYLNRLLLGQLACGLAPKLVDKFGSKDSRIDEYDDPDVSDSSSNRDNDPDSPDTLQCFKNVVNVQFGRYGHQLKFFWDKAMWLARWIEDVPWTPQNRLSPLTKLIFRMCAEMKQAAETRNYELFGDKRCLLNEAAVILAEALKHVENAMRGAWIDKFHLTRSRFIWIDFFDMDPSVVDKLSHEQLLFLVRDCCYMRRKVGLGFGPGLVLHRFETVSIEALLSENLQQRACRPIRSDGYAAELDFAFVESTWETAELRGYIKKWLALKPGKPNWEASEVGFTGEIEGYDSLEPKERKEAILLKLNQGNLKCSPITTLDKLKKLLWEHMNGVAEPKMYRDGRGTPDRYHDFVSATAAFSSLNDQQTATVEAMKETMSPLSRALEDFRITYRHYQYIAAFESLAPRNAQVRKRKTCTKCRARLRVPSLEAYLVVACGHILCRKCRYHKSSGCPIANCPASTRGRPVLRSSYIQRQLDHAVNYDKVQYVMDQIQHILMHKPDDYILVFAQYRGIIEALWEEIEKLGCGATNLTNNARDASTALKKFQNGEGGRILLMDIDSDSSAGSNLFIANHIIFANPFHHSDKAHQARTVLQARGRCIRQGQEKKVYIYHFMVPNTIEERTMRELAESRSLDKIAEYFERHHEYIPWWLDNDAGAISPPAPFTNPYQLQPGDPVWRGELFERV